MTDFDGSWKEGLEYALPAFLAMFFPVSHEDLNWSIDHESLEQELRELLPKGESGRRLCDKLIKAFLKDTGDPVYLHIEAQNQREADFERRVHVYNYRAEDKFNQPVVSLVILGDDDPDWRPHEYVSERWGCKKTFAFPIVKLIDYRGHEQELEANPNPFALLVLAHLLALDTRQDMETRRDGKIRLIRLLYEREKEAEDRRQWFRILDWMLPLPEELARVVIAETIQREDQTMTRMTSFEWIGRLDGLRRGIRVALQIKFGVADPAFVKQIDKADIPALESVLDALPTATSLDDLCQFLVPATGDNGHP